MTRNWHTDHDSTRVLPVINDAIVCLDWPIEKKLPSQIRSKPALFSSDMCVLVGGWLGGWLVE